MPDVTMLIKPASGLCNMRCQYCFYFGEPEHQNGIMTDEMLERLMQRVFEYAGGRPCNVNFAWQGGEPTLAGVEYFEKAVALSKQYNTAGHRLNYSIQTNGYDVSRELAELFAREHFLVGVSLDGNREIHDMNRRDAAGAGTYDRVLKTVKLFRELGVEFNILCVVSRAVARNAARVYDALTSAGFEFLQFIPCLDGDESGPYSLDSKLFGRFLCTVFDRWYDDVIHGKAVSIRDFDNYLMRAAGLPSEICTMRGVCGCYFTVESNGDVFPCDFYVTPEWKIGNVTENSLAEMLKSGSAIRFIEDSKDHPQSCRDCRWYAFCGSGCRRQRGDDRVSRFCESYKAFFDHAGDRLIALSRRLR